MRFFCLVFLFFSSPAAADPRSDKIIIDQAVGILKELKTPIAAEIVRYFRESGTRIRFEKGACNLGAGTNPPDLKINPNMIILGGGLKKKSLYVIAGFLAHEGIHALQFREKKILDASRKHMGDRGLKGVYQHLTFNVRPIPFLEVEAVRLSAPVLRELKTKTRARDISLDRLEAAAGGNDMDVWKAYEKEFDYLNDLNKRCRSHKKEKWKKAPKHRF